MLEPGVADPPERVVIDSREIDAGDLRPDQRVPPRDRNAIVHAGCEPTHRKSSEVASTCLRKRNNSCSEVSTLARENVPEFKLRTPRGAPRFAS
jgi:hypothetical protein